MTQPTVDSLLAANDRFYRTFEALDLAAMTALWENSERVYCVHPGWPALRGTAAVLDSWKRIMANTSVMRFTLTGIRGWVDGNIGIVTCYENLFTEAGYERHASGVVSTNLFAWDAAAGAWKLFHHHAAHAEVPKEDEDALLN